MEYAISLQNSQETV